MVTLKGETHSLDNVFQWCLIVRGYLFIGDQGFLHPHANYGQHQHLARGGDGGHAVVHEPCADLQLRPNHGEA